MKKHLNANTSIARKKEKQFSYGTTSVDVYCPTLWGERGYPLVQPGRRGYPIVQSGGEGYSPTQELPSQDRTWTGITPSPWTDRQTENITFRTLRMRLVVILTTKRR